jgi:hypothetical protein
MPSVQPIKTRKRKPNTPNLADTTLDDATASRARSWLRRERFEDCERLIAGAADPNDRAYYTEALADWPSESVAIRRWVALKPSAVAQRVALIHAAKQSWNLSPWTRGQVDPAAFRQALGEVKDGMLKLAKADAQDASIFPWLQWVARGLSDPDLSRKAVAEGIRREPRLRALYSSALYSESPSWFGESEEALLEFAKRQAAAAPRGIGACVLPIEAHWLNATMHGPGDSYWKRPDVRADALAAHASLEADPPPGVNGTRAWQGVLYALWKAGEGGAAAQHAPHVGRAPNEWPWGSVRLGLDRIFNDFYKARRVRA